MAKEFEVVGDEVYYLGKWPRTRKGSTEQSLRKWQFIKRYVKRTGHIPRADSGSCGLCQRYVERTGTCKNCPISKATQEVDCRGTTYYQYHLARFRNDSDKAVIAAGGMVKLLKSLL